MSREARELLIALLLLSVPALVAREVWNRGALGVEAPVAPCAVAVEVAGMGVECLTPKAAAAWGVAGGERIAIDPRGASIVGRMAPERLALFRVPIDVNRASDAELQSLDGIGPALAQRVIAARPFSVLGDVGAVKGIGMRRLERLRDRLKLDGAHDAQ